MTAVFKHSQSKGSARLVLLALADEASDEGMVTAYRRSQSHLARKGNMDGGTVSRSTKALVDLGELEVLRQGDGRASTDYRIILPGVSDEGVQIAYPAPASRLPRGGISPTQGVQDAPPIIPFSPTEPHIASSKRSCFPAPGLFLLTDAMKEWAAKEAPNVDVVLQTKQFADHWRGKGEKRADWVATWRTWIRNAEAWDRGGRRKGSAPSAPGATSNTRTFASEEEYEAWQATQK